MSLIQAKDVDKFKVKLVETGNSQNFQLNSKSAVAPKHEDLTALAASIQGLLKILNDFLLICSILILLKLTTWFPLV